MPDIITLAFIILGALSISACVTALVNQHFRWLLDER